MPTLTAIPGMLLDRTLKLARLPLTLAESTIRPDAKETAWAPHMAFERFEAHARETIGKLLGDQRLLDRATLQRAKLRQIDRAQVIDVEAGTKAEQAQETLEQRREQAEDRRTTAQRKADEREDELERAQQEAKSTARKDAAEKKKKAKEAADRRTETARAREDAATRRQLDDKAAALTKKEQAAATKARALDLEDKAEQTKTVRKHTSGTPSTTR